MEHATYYSTYKFFLIFCQKGKKRKIKRKKKSMKQIVGDNYRDFFIRQLKFSDQDMKMYL